MYEYFVIGKIVNTQGIKGEVRVIPMTDDLNRFKKLKEVYLDIKNELKVFKINTVRFHKQFVLIKFDGIDDMTQAERLKLVEVKIHKDDALKCEENEYYIGDLYDMKVVTDEGEFLGKIEDIIFTGANDVYIVKDENKQILIPAIKDCILDVDINSKTMKVHLLEGLR